MADMDITVGGRSYRVACKDGEERHLSEVADLLAAEADMLRRQFGALPEPRLLLMAGLLVADKLHGARDELERAADGGPADEGGLFDARDSEGEIAALRAALSEATARAEAAESAADSAVAAAQAAAGAAEEDRAAQARAAEAEERISAAERRAEEAEAAEADARKALADAAERMRDLTAGLRSGAAA